MNDPSSMSQEEQIARIAYHIYEEEGCQDGHCAEHWARAERIIREQRMGTPHSDGPGAEALEPPAHMVP